MKQHSKNAIDVLAPFSLDGKTAIVTGASGGLGERFVRVLHAAGATVVAAARRTDRINALAEELGERVIAHTCDVSSDQEIDRLTEAGIEAGNGRIDILVNNAGVTHSGPAEEESRDGFRHVIDINLNALFVVSQSVGRVMLETGGGSIVNVASMLGLVAGSPLKQASYCASKGGVINLTRELAVQWAGKDVRVNALAPGYFPSEMTTDLFGNEKPLEFVRRNTPMSRGGEIHEFDGAILFLCSKASSYVTGHTLVVDGGWTAR